MSVVFRRALTGLVVLSVMFLTGAHLPSAAAVRSHQNESRAAQGLLRILESPATTIYGAPAPGPDGENGHDLACCITGLCSTPLSMLPGVIAVPNVRIPPKQPYPPVVQARADGIAIAPGLQPPQPSV